MSKVKHRPHISKDSWEECYGEKISSFRTVGEKEIIRKLLENRETCIIFWVGDSTFSLDITKKIRKKAKKGNCIYNFITIPDSLIEQMNQKDSPYSGVVYKIGIIRASAYKLKQSLLTAIKVEISDGETYVISSDLGIKVSKPGVKKTEVFNSISINQYEKEDRSYINEIKKLNPNLPEVPEKIYKVKFPIKPSVEIQN